MSWVNVSPVGAIAAALILSGCVSGTPRPYAPILQPPPADQVAFERDFTVCAEAVAAGERNFEGSTSAVVVGAVGGVAAVEVLSGAAAATAVGGSAGLAVTGVGLLVVVPLTTYALSSARRRRNERDIQEAMTACLGQKGHTVADWTRLARRDATSLALVTPTTRIPPTSP